MNLFRLLLLGAVIALLTGCVSKTEEEEYKPPVLMIAQNGDGDVTIAWESDPDYFYTVFYQADAESDWMGLQGANRVPGTGLTITVNDHVNPNKPLRRYRILPEKMP